MNHGSLLYTIHFYIYPPLASILLVWAYVSAPFSLVTGLWLLLLGALSWGLVDYTVHRWVFHVGLSNPGKRTVFSRAHLAHHDDPQDIRFVFVQAPTSVPMSILIFGGLWLATSVWQIAALVFLGILIGFTFYEFAHYSAHFRTPRTAVGRYLKKYHMLHHYQDANSRYGVTSPLVDLLLGTYQPVPAPSVVGQAAGGPTE